MILGILQARVSSTRLPNKVLKEILGRPMLSLQIERLKRSKLIDKLIVATSTEPSDDDLEELCRREGIDCFRGSLNDVLDRFYRAAETHHPDIVVRLTGDCPLTDPIVVDHVIRGLDGYDYASNVLTPTFPDGLDVEVFRFGILETAWREASKPSEREHVTPFIYANPERFRLHNISNENDLSELRWTVDEAEDFQFVSCIYENLYGANPNFTTEDILSFLSNGGDAILKKSKFRRNEGLVKSMKADKKAEWTKKIAKSMAMQERAKKRIPGMTQLLSKRPDMFSYRVWPGYFQEASGVEVIDLDGNRYVDMSIGGIGANVLGYRDSEVDEAVLKVIKSGNSSSLNAPEEIELADLLCEIHPWAEQVRYSRAGGESMAIAVRLARASTRRDVVAFCGYHGWHDWYLAANLGTENALGEHLIPGLSPVGVPQGLAGTSFPFKYNSLESLKDIVSKHGKNLAAIVMEPIRNVNPVPGFLEGVRSIANETGAVFIIDEISAGFRMNSGGAHLIYGINPDMAVFSKALGNGYPIGAIIGTEKVMSAAQTTFISSTYWTERIGPAAALATILKHRSVNAGKHLMNIGTLVQKGWQEMADKIDLKIHVGGIPPLSHFTFEYPDSSMMKAYFIQLMMEEGFLASTSFYSMYAHSTANVESYIRSVEKAFTEIKSANDDNAIGDRLLGDPSVSGFARLN